MNDGLIDQERMCKLLGCKQPAMASRLLKKEGIVPISGRNGHWFVTIDQINAARGIIKNIDTIETVLF